MKWPLFGHSSLPIFPEVFPSPFGNPRVLVSFKSVPEGVSNMIRKLRFAIKSTGCMVVYYVFSHTGSSSRLPFRSSFFIYRLHLCRSGLFNLFRSFPFSHRFLAFEHSIHYIYSQNTYKVSSTVFQPDAHGNFQNSVTAMISPQKYSKRGVSQ